MYVKPCTLGKILCAEATPSQLSFLVITSEIACGRVRWAGVRPSTRPLPPPTSEDYILTRLSSL